MQNSWETLVSVQTKVSSRKTGPAGNRQGATGARAARPVEGGLGPPNLESVDLEGESNREGAEPEPTSL